VALASMRVFLRSCLATTCVSLALMWALPGVAASVVHGPAVITDGDTVVVEGQKIRLIGIDAPESDQLCLNREGQTWTCGIAARDALIRRAGHRTLTCVLTGQDRYKRALGHCGIEGEDVGRWMVRNGWALPFIRYSREYEADGQAARTARSGLWAGAFIAPWDWRRRDCTTNVLSIFPISIEGHRLLCGSPSTPPDPSCTIKANLSSRGCIYHMPSDRHYGPLKMEGPRKRWFCSAGEANAAGCRRARR